MAPWGTIAPCRQPANLRRTIRIANATALAGAKIVLNFCVPFIVSNLGVLAATRTAHEI